MRQLPNLGPFGELEIDQWVSEPPAETLAELRGQVIAIEAFQMLCPGCVTHGLPQAKRLAQTFGDELIVIGLHTVFEHHDAMTPTALKAFLHEYRIPFPVAIDKPQGKSVPVTMARLGLQGTPSLLLIDKAGDLRLNAFGQVDDLPLGAVVSSLILES